MAEGAFGVVLSDGGEAGSCPAVEPLSPAECEGQVSTCWSPGQRDTDCPANGLCCVSSLKSVSKDGGNQTTLLHLLQG